MRSVYPSHPFDRKDLSGKVLDRRHELLERVGQGGMCDVYRAYFIPGETYEAVKILDSELTQDEEHIQRFRAEFRILHRLKHPGLVNARDYSRTSDGVVYFSMDLLGGECLDELLRREGPVTAAQAIRILLPLCDALQHLHDNGIIHRDVKPSNIRVVVDQGQTQVMLLDLGIARRMPRFYAYDRRYSTPVDKRLRTRTGIALGTPGYRAPEVTSRSADNRVDVFSVGVVLFELLTGRRPFSDPSGPFLHPPDLEAELEYVPCSLNNALRQAVAGDPAERPDTIAKLRELLEDALLDVDDEYTPADGLPTGEQRNGLRARPTRPLAGWVSALWVAVTLALTAALTAAFVSGAVAGRTGGTSWR